MESSPSLPVVQGVELTLSCTEGYGLRGDEKITCQKDNEFTYQTSPQCGEWILLFNTQHQVLPFDMMQA